MTTRPPLVLHIALPVPVRHHFDYLVDSSITKCKIETGMRVIVPFGRGKQRVGMVVGTSSSSDVSPSKLKPIIELVDEEPLFDNTHFKLLKWSSDYYHYPLGELIFTTLPGSLRQGKKAQHHLQQIWQLNKAGKQFNSNDLTRAKKQQALLNFLSHYDQGCPAEILDHEFTNWRTPLKALVEKGLVDVRSLFQTTTDRTVNEASITFNDEQTRAFDIITAGLNSGSPFLLDGITGSGKTEIYLEAIKMTVSQGKQALVLVPEIGLTPHFTSRFKHRIPAQLVVLHSGLSDGERLQAWLKSRDGMAQVVLGTRSAVWTPLKNPGLFIVDEEHDQSYKQQDGLHYSARDIAVLRASNTGSTVILGSATPSLESLHNVERKKLNQISLHKRAENAVPPKFKIIDLRGQQITGALSATLLSAIGDVLKQKKQVLLFQNRRGYSPVLLCHDCGWVHMCIRCNIPLTFHKNKNRLICHHCGHQELPSSSCHECESDNLVQIGHGTERLNETLKDCFPSANILRIDRDTTRHKGSMQDYMEQINSGTIDILVGTQMLAKGHHFPKVTLVGIIDGDRGLYSNDFRASERMAQLIIQVSGRAGRAQDPGLVIIQTHYPDHPFLTTLVQNNYGYFAKLQLTERKVSNLPPYSYQALLRADSHEEKVPLSFLQSAAREIKGLSTQLDIYGPFPAPIEKRAGRYRFQLMVQSNSRTGLHKVITPWIEGLEQIKEGKKIRWSLDVDPQDLL